MLDSLVVGRGRRHSTPLVLLSTTTMMMLSTTTTLCKKTFAPLSISGRSRSSRAPASAGIDDGAKDRRQVLKLLFGSSAAVLSGSNWKARAIVEENSTIDR